MKITVILLFITLLHYSKAAQLAISKLETGQTHIIPETGLSWNLTNQKESLHLIGNRETLLLLQFNGLVNLVSAQVEGLIGSQVLGPLSLNSPSELPLTESNGTAYSTTSYNVLLPKSWLIPGIKIRAMADGYDPSDYKTLDVGLASKLDLFILPFYLFGANDSNSLNFSQTSTIPTKNYNELYNKWPVSELNVKSFGLKRIDWPYLILRPNGTNQGFRAQNKDQQRDGFEVMGYILGFLGSIRSVNGISSTNNQFYAPILWLNSVGKSVGTGGGLGTIGGSTGTGDTSFSGIFIHEQGHAFGLPHALDAYNSGKYPYVNGSLLGCSWGFDINHNELLSTLMPTTASSYKNCADNYVVNGNGQCIKQTPMQGGSGTQSSGYIYSMFADYEMGVMQRYFEGSTNASTSVHTYSGGKIIPSSSFPSGYCRWDSVDKKLVEFVPTLTDKGLYGFNAGFPEKLNVPVYTIFSTISLAKTQDLTQVYPPLYYNGNLLTYIDPTNSSQLALIKPNSGPVPWYCHASGCDFTARSTFSDNSTLYYLLQTGLRGWFDINGNISQDYYDPLFSDSLKTFSFNIPAQKDLVRVEIFFTPNGYNGFPQNPEVLLDFSCSGSKSSLSCSQYKAPVDSDANSSDISLGFKNNINYFINFVIVLFILSFFIKL